MKKVLRFVLIGLIWLVANTYCHAAGNWVNAQSWIQGVTGTAELWTMKCVSCTASDLTVTSMTVLDGILNVPYIFLDVPTKDDDIILDSNGVELTLSTLATNGTSYITADLVQPAYPPRAVIVFASITVANVSMTSATLTMKAYISGINSVGISTNEYVTVVTTAGAGVGISNVAYISISSISMIATSTYAVINNNIVNNIVKIQIGTADKIGLPNSLFTTSDINSYYENGINRSTATSAQFNATYNTFTPLLPTNASLDYMAIHNVKLTPRR